MRIFQGLPVQKERNRNPVTDIEYLLKDKFGTSYMTANQPRDRRMDDISHIEGMNSENIRLLINELCRDVKTYVEVGCFHGASLISAAYNNEGCTCYGIDNFDLYNAHSLNERILYDNTAPFKNIRFTKGDYNDELPKLLKSIPPVDVYLFDGPHTYVDQHRGLEMVEEHLAEHHVILVDDVNWPVVRKANEDWAKGKNYNLITITTPFAGHKGWWNGIQIFWK